MTEKQHSPEEWLQKIGGSRNEKGKLKVYLGMSAGVGKTYRMLQEAHQLLKDGVDVRIGYIETHNRKETQALVEGIEHQPDGEGGTEHDEEYDHHALLTVGQHHGFSSRSRRARSCLSIRLRASRGWMRLRTTKAANKP